MPAFTDLELQAVFQRLDTDHSGRIDVYELQKVVQRHLPDDHEAHQAALRLIEQVDENHDGQVDYREFCIGVQDGKFPGMAKAKVKAPAAPLPAAPPAPAVDLAADDTEFERRQQVAADAEAVEREELAIERELERREHELDAEASRVEAEAARENRVLSSLQALAESEHEKLRQEEERLKEEQRGLRQVYSAGVVPSDIRDPTSLTTALYESDRQAELIELRRAVDAERREIEHEKQLVAERDAAAQAELAKAAELRAAAEHARSEEHAAQRQVEREQRLLQSQHRVVVADKAEASQAQRKVATEVFRQLFDTEGTGSISLSTLHHKMSDFGHSESEIQSLCHCLEADADGMLSVDAFVRGYPRYHSLVS